MQVILQRCHCREMKIFLHQRYSPCINGMVPGLTVLSLHQRYSPSTIGTLAAPTVLYPPCTHQRYHQKATGNASNGTINTATTEPGHVVAAAVMARAAQTIAISSDLVSIRV